MVNGLLITSADIGSIPDGFPLFGLVIDCLHYKRLKLVHDDPFNALVSTWVRMGRV